MVEKVCSKCDIKKPLKEFHKDSSKKDGLHTVCKLCKGVKGSTSRGKHYIIVNGESKKYCFKCKQYLDTKKFNKNTSRYDGLDNRCRKCKKKYYQENNIEIKNKRKEYWITHKDQCAKSAKKYCSQNRIKILKYRKKYNLLNIEKVKKLVRDYYNKNREKLLRYHAEYKKRHRDKYILYDLKRRHIKNRINEVYSDKDLKYTRKLFKNKCFNCGAKEHLHIDHHYPLSKGHALTRKNAVILCRSCNCSKRSKNPEDFYSLEKFKEITKILKSDE